VKRVLSKLMSYRKQILGVTIVMVAILLTLFLYQRSRVGGPDGQVSASVLEEYVRQIRNAPYDGALLLRSARHHFYLVRQQLNQSGVRSSDLREVIERGLEHYRRIEAAEEWSLTRSDYFYNAYLYYQLAQSFRDNSRRFAYVNRAKDMALRSYERGHRSPELITLLGNLHYQTGEYDVALDYYATLGSDVNDPQILFNKAWVHRSQGNYDRATRLITRAIERLPGDTDEARRRRFELARVRILVDKGEYRNAINRLQSMPDYQESPRAQTLYASALIELGFRPEARRILEEVVNGEGTPDMARRLLDNLRNNDDDIRS
jgi:tetratricopeptide (TPR) repeat protein